MCCLNAEECLLHFFFLIMLSHPLTRVGSTHLLYRLALTSELSRAGVGFRQARALFEPVWKAWRHRPLLSTDRICSSDSQLKSENKSVVCLCTHSFFMHIPPAPKAKTSAVHSPLSLTYHLPWLSFLTKFHQFTSKCF